MTFSHAAKSRKRKKKKVKCAPPKRRRPNRNAKSSDLGAAAARKRQRRKKRPVCKKPKHPHAQLPSGMHPAASEPATQPIAGPAAPVPPPPLPQGPSHTIQTPIGFYEGPFGQAQAERLLWRAGFGPLAGQAKQVAALGLEAAVLSLTRPQGTAPMDGPEPTTEDGTRLAPYDRAGDDLLYWLDRMVRSRQQLVERLALVFHDWFATSNAKVNSQRLMLDQTNVFRAHGLGSFNEMVRAITRDPAMILFLDQATNRRGSPNENYARELMELFTLGADRGAYTEQDVRELGRSLTGFRFDRVAGVGTTNFRWDPALWDSGSKTVFGKTGTYNWEDACRKVVAHPLHPSFFVRKLWSYFIPLPPDPGTSAKLETLYTSSGYAIRPVLEAILCSRQLYEGPRMVKPPMVLAAGIMRARRRPITKRIWTSLCDNAGQRVYYPPDVSGWDDKRWLSTTTVLARWTLVLKSLLDDVVPPTSTTYSIETPGEALAAARAFWGDPSLTNACVGELRTFAAGALPPLAAPRLYAQRQNALRQLIGASPDYQTS